jgi:hypothetical protein
MFGPKHLHAPQRSGHKTNPREESLAGTTDELLSVLRLAPRVNAFRKTSWIPQLLVRDFSAEMPVPGRFLTGRGFEDQEPPTLASAQERRKSYPS